MDSVRPPPGRVRFESVVEPPLAPLAAAPALAPAPATVFADQDFYQLNQDVTAAIAHMHAEAQAMQAMLAEMRKTQDYFKDEEVQMLEQQSLAITQAADAAQKEAADFERLLNVLGSTVQGRLRFFAQHAALLEKNRQLREYYVDQQTELMQELKTALQAKAAAIHNLIQGYTTRDA